MAHSPSLCKHSVKQANITSEKEAGALEWPLWQIHLFLPLSWPYTKSPSLGLSFPPLRTAVTLLCQPLWEVEPKSL